MTRCTETYEADDYAWTQEQVRALCQAGAARVNLDIDFDHLAEEVEDLGNSERFAVESAVIRVIEHVLKLEHSPAVDPRAGWEDSVTKHRIRIARKLVAMVIGGWIMAETRGRRHAPTGRLWQV